MHLALITPPSSEPITIHEVREHIRGIRTDAEDILLSTFIESARTQAEAFTRRDFITRTWDMYMDAVPDSSVLEIPNPPLSSVTSVTTIDESEVSTVFASTNYVVDTVSSPGRIALKSGITWPPTTLKAVNGFVVRFVSGYGNSEAVPEQIRHALLRAVDFFYSDRTGDLKMPDEVKHMLMPYKVWRV